PKQPEVHSQRSQGAPAGHGSAVGRRGVDLTNPNASVGWVHAYYHPSTDAPGVGSMPQLGVWRKRTHWHPFAQTTPLHLPCLWQPLCSNIRPPVFGKKTPALYHPSWAGFAWGWLAAPGGGLPFWPRGARGC